MQATSTKSYQQLQPEDRLTLASLRQLNLGIRAIAQVLGRAPSTISREVSRNASHGQYGSTTAQRSCVQRRRHARPQPKLHADSVLFAVVQHFLKLRWAPEQIAMTLASIYPKGHELRVSHETIYNCI